MALHFSPQQFVEFDQAKENVGGVVCARLFVYLTQLHVIWLMHDQGTEGLNPRNRILRLVEFVAQETVESAVNNLPIRLKMTTKETIPRQHVEISA
jgi:hypothetical protein